MINSQGDVSTNSPKLKIYSVYNDINQRRHHILTTEKQAPAKRNDPNKWSIFKFVIVVVRSLCHCVRQIYYRSTRWNGQIQRSGQRQQTRERLKSKVRERVFLLKYIDGVGGEWGMYGLPLPRIKSLLFLPRGGVTEIFLHGFLSDCALFFFSVGDVVRGNV